MWTVATTGKDKTGRDSRAVRWKKLGNVKENHEIGEQLQREIKLQINQHRENGEWRHIWDQGQNIRELQNKPQSTKRAKEVSRDYPKLYISVANSISSKQFFHSSHLAASKNLGCCHRRRIDLAEWIPHYFRIPITTHREAQVTSSYL